MTRAATFLGIAAAAGTIHGVASIYWGLGGTALLDTLGTIADRFDVRWLVLVGVLKVMAALLPLRLLRTPPPASLLRLACWCGSVGLIVWGGVNTVSAWLLLLDVVTRPDDFDRMGTVGHAAIWDPLFFLWGVSLAVGLLLTRRMRDR